MPAIKAKLDVLLCSLPGRQRRVTKAETEVKALRREKCKAEQADQPFVKHAEVDKWLD